MPFHAVECSKSVAPKTKATAHNLSVACQVVMEADISQRIETRSTKDSVQTTIQECCVERIFHR